MLNRRAILCVIVVAAVTVGAVHADPAGQSSFAGKPAVQPSAQVEAPRVSWARMLGTYRLLLGFSLAHPALWEQPYEILGVQDGPDGADPLGVKTGIKGLTPKPNQDPDAPQDAPDPSLN